jgi:hypothetical protein
MGTVNRAKGGFMSIKKVFVCSPLRGDIESNIKKAEAYCYYVCSLGNIPYAPHVFFTRFLDELKEEEREIGIAGGIEFLKVCDECWVFGENITEGMRREIEVCSECGIPVKFINLGEVLYALASASV